MITWNQMEKQILHPVFQGCLAEVICMKKMQMIVVMCTHCSVYPCGATIAALCLG